MFAGEVVAASTAAQEWWMVASLAGAFTILGVIISGLGTWLNEALKAKRDKKRANESELVEAGAAMLTVSENFRRVALQRLTHSQEEFAAHVTKVADELTDSLHIASSRMQLVMPAALEEVQNNLIAHNALLILPVFDEGGIRKVLTDHGDAVKDFKDALRKHRGMAPLKFLSTRGERVDTATMMERLLNYAEKLRDAPAGGAHQASE